MFTENSDTVRVYDIHGIKDNEREILTFLQGAVYCWCLNKGTEWFSVRSFIGGINGQIKNLRRLS